MTQVPLKLACGNLRPDRVGAAALLAREQTEGGWQDIRCSHSWRASHEEDGLEESMRQ